VDLAVALRFVHVLLAFAYVAGYVGTNAMTEAARRTTDDARLRTAIAWSGMFDQRLMVPASALLAFAGLATALVGGYSLTAPWLVLASVLYVAVIAVGIVLWGRVGRAIEAALRSNDLQRARALLNAPRLVLLSRGENVVVFVIVALMVLRWPR
jgi:uncharacterized membrane protein